MKGCSARPEAPALLEPRHQIACGGLRLSREYTILQPQLAEQNVCIVTAIGKLGQNGHKTNVIIRAFLNLQSFGILVLPPDVIKCPRQIPFFYIFFWSLNCLYGMQLVYIMSRRQGLKPFKFSAFTWTWTLFNYISGGISN